MIVATGRLLFSVNVSTRLNAKLAELFIFSGVFGLPVPDSRRELLVLELIILEYSFYASYTLSPMAQDLSDKEIRLLAEWYSSIRIEVRGAD